MLRPRESDNVTFDIVALKGEHFIEINQVQTRIDHSLDFDLNKFTNRFEWYNRETWRVIFPNL
jgi:hypothetical protein